MAKMTDADLIIAGTHGVTGFEQYWIGSNAYRIVSYAPCPVITVRFDFDFDNDIRNVVLPIDATPDTRQKVPLPVGWLKHWVQKCTFLDYTQPCLNPCKEKQQVMLKML
jgi:hypothetical protein